MRRSFIFSFALAIVATTAALASPAPLKWPPWLSVESPVNPYDPGARGALMLVHVAFREGDASMSDLSGTAEGIVAGGRRSIPLRFTETGRANTFALRRQWPAEGTWLVKLAVRQTTALVTFDRQGAVASVRVPVSRSGDMELPRAVSPREVDSTLVAASRR
ncbi:MAG: hypothetical protein ACJ79K_02585 [Gemmatimonadaceae bacterium]